MAGEVGLRNGKILLLGGKWMIGCCCPSSSSSSSSMPPSSSSMPSSSSSMPSSSAPPVSSGGTSSSADNRLCYFKWHVYWNTGTETWGMVTLMESQCDNTFGLPLNTWQFIGSAGSECEYQIVTQSGTCGAYDNGCENPNNLEMPNPPSPPSDTSQCPNTSGQCLFTWQATYDCAGQIWSGVTYVSSSCSGIAGSWTFVSKSNGQCLYQITTTQNYCDQYEAGCNAPSPDEMPTPPSLPMPDSNCQCETCYITWRVYWSCVGQVWSGVSYVSSACSNPGGGGGSWQHVGTADGFCEYQITLPGGYCDSYVNRCSSPSPGELPTPPAPPTNIDFNCQCPPSSGSSSSSN